MSTVPWAGRLDDEEEALSSRPLLKPTWPPKTQTFLFDGGRLLRRLGVIAGPQGQQYAESWNLCCYGLRRSSAESYALVLGSLQGSSGTQDPSCEAGASSETSVTTRHSPVTDLLWNSRLWFLYKFTYSHSGKTELKTLLILEIVNETSDFLKGPKLSLFSIFCATEKLGKKFFQRLLRNYGDFHLVFFC